MSTFWNFVAAIFIIAVVLLAADMTTDNGFSTDSEIRFTDLETECRYDRRPVAEVGSEGNSITFQGGFHVPEPSQGIDYDYSKSGNQVDLNIFTGNSTPLNDYSGTCAGLAVYDGKTRSLDPGLYYVTVRHDGEKVKEVGIRID